MELATMELAVTANDVLAAFEPREQAARDYHTIYRQLRSIARYHRRGWSGNDTLNTTALINEAWLKMHSAPAEYQDRTHFFATAARVMRQVLINYAERGSAQKRISPEQDSEDNLLSRQGQIPLDELLFIDRLLNALEQDNPRGSHILECRIFGGMTIEETAKALDTSVSTVKREWTLLSAWLYHELGENCNPRKL